MLTGKSRISSTFVLLLIVDLNLSTPSFFLDGTCQKCYNIDVLLVGNVICLRLKAEWCYIIALSRFWYEIHDYTLKRRAEFLSKDIPDTSHAEQEYLF